MAFQPFGYRFEVKAPLSPPEVKAAIRSRTKKLFDPDNGARGWIAGPFICLWLEPLNQRGPMLLGTISRADRGTRIAGRAGSDLNGVAVLAVMLPLMTYIFFQIVVAGDARSVASFGLSLLLFPLFFWLSHKARREAEPLVSFLRNVLTNRAPAARAIARSTALGLNVAGKDREVTPEAIRDALLGMSPGDFVILSSAPERYIRAAFHDGGYMIEMRDGSRQRHFEAMRRSAAPPSAGGAGSIFTFEEVLEAFDAYAAESPMPNTLSWRPMQLPD